MSLLWSIERLSVWRPDGTVLVGPERYEIPRRRLIALVGESGSGKTLTLRALAGVTPEGLKREMSSPQTTPRTAMVFQDPASFFNPRWRVGRSLREVLQTVRGMNRASVDQESQALMGQVGLEVGDLRRYPFEMSGGMIQRAGIAMALATQPELLLADEITSALDPELGGRVLMLLHELSRRRDMSVVLVSHDLRAVARVADTVRVLYRGRVVEQGPPGSVLSSPRHRYTDLLLRSLPEAGRRGRPLPELAPVPPGAAPRGCPFRLRCPAAQSDCASMPQWDPRRRYRCHHPVPPPEDLDEL